MRAYTLFTPRLALKQRMKGYFRVSFDALHGSRGLLNRGDRGRPKF
jgi:hypothetical protein